VRTTVRAGLAVTCVAGLAAAPLAGAVDTTIRVEGASATLVPESAIPIEGSGTATVFDRNFAPVDVDRSSAFWQLYRATSSTGLGFEFELFPAFSSILVQRVGPDANAGSVGWQFRVDHVAPPVGADKETLAQGDTVLWYYGASDGARELDVAPSGDRVAKGAPVTVTVTSYAADGASEPGSGATVRYGGATAVADAAGTATFVAQGNGTQTVSATRAGDIRSAARPVCSYEGDPTACNLPAAASPAAPTAQAGGDTVAPGSRISFPLIGHGHAAVRGIRGTAGPDRSDVARVDVAVARRVGTQCRFRAASGGLTRPRPCGQRLFVKARSAGGNWSLGLGRGLAPGLWRAWSRATDGAGNVEKVGIAGVNTGQFRVLGAAAKGTRRAGR
jgi:hypothetical protein